MAEFPDTPTELAAEHDTMEGGQTSAPETSEAELEEKMDGAGETPTPAAAAVQPQGENDDAPPDGFDDTTGADAAGFKKAMAEGEKPTPPAAKDPGQGEEQGGEPEATLPKTLKELEEFQIERDNPADPNAPHKTTLAQLFEADDKVREAGRFIEDENGNKTNYDSAGYTLAISENAASPQKSESDNATRLAGNFLENNLPLFEQAHSRRERDYHNAINSEDPDGAAVARAARAREHSANELQQARAKAQGLIDYANAKGGEYATSSVNNLWQKTFPDSEIGKNVEAREKMVDGIATQLENIYGFKQAEAKQHLLNEPSLARAMRDAVLYHASRTAGKTTQGGGKQVKRVRFTAGGGSASKAGANGAPFAIDPNADEHTQNDQLANNLQRILDGQSGGSGPH